MSFLQNLFTLKHRVDVRSPDVSKEPALSAQMLSLAARLEQLSPHLAQRLLEQLCTGLAAETTEAERYFVAEALATAVYPKYKFSEYARIYLEDEAFLTYYQKSMDVGNWHSLDRKYTLNQLLKLVRSLNGEIAECGVYKGASAYLMCEMLQGSGRSVHLFDSFEGLSDPDHRDGTYWVKGALPMPEQVVHETLAGFSHYRTYKGWIPDRFAEVANLPFSFLHIDVDLYQPTLASLTFFYPRIEKRGVILMDDYGFSTCPGAKRAADEFFADKPEEIVMLSTGQAFVVKR